MNWYIKVLKNYTNFDGRARRKEFWGFILFSILFGILAIFIDHLLGTEIGSGTYGLPLIIGRLEIGSFIYGVFFIVYGLAMFLPSVAVTVRRLHDTGRSGWMILISLIPIIGEVWLFILMVLDGDAGMNQYGPNPKEIDQSNSD